MFFVTFILFFLERGSDIIRFYQFGVPRMSGMRLRACDFSVALLLLLQLLLLI